VTFRVQDCPVGDNNRLACGLSIPKLIREDMEQSIENQTAPKNQETFEWVDKHHRTHKWLEKVQRQI
jgi:hypothetical protein